MTGHAHNARSVVAEWRAGRHVNVWAEPARSMEPSRTTRAYAHQLADLSATCDLAANTLQTLGFLPSHPAVTALRADASTYARRANQSFAWADALEQAERELTEAEQAAAEASGATRSAEP